MSDLSLIASVLKKHQYVMNHAVGEGAFAHCYLVYSEQYKCEFVAKILKSPEDGDEDRYVQMFQYETSICEKVFHRNLLRCYDYFREGLIFVIIMEYCEKGSISELMKNDKNLVKDKILIYSHQIISALEALHSNNIVHFDIKPQNILIDQYGKAKLADFGLSRFINEGSHSRAKRGTTCYMAPEMMNADNYDPYKTDIWSLGVTIFQMAGAEVPTNCKTIKDIRQAIVEDAINMGFIGKLIIKCLAVNPAERPTATELRLMVENEIKSKNELKHFKGKKGSGSIIQIRPKIVTPSVRPPNRKIDVRSTLATLTARLTV